MTHHLIVLTLSLGICAIGLSNGEATTKRGAVYNDVEAVGPLAKTGQVSWAYNWAMSESGNLPEGVEFVPMLWGRKNIPEWRDYESQGHLNGSKYILGFNEPDQPTQATLSPSSAASLYKEYITRLQNGRKLISPAVSSSNVTGEGLEWLNEFMKRCSSCGISGIAVHWYGSSAAGFKSFIREAIEFCRSHHMSELWITEFSLEADINGFESQLNPETAISTASDFIQEVTSWLDSQTVVTRYSYFKCADGFLLAGKNLNRAGEAYVSPSRCGGLSGATPS